MERLTLSNNKIQTDAGIWILKNGNPKELISNDCDEYEYFKKLAEYEDLEEQGRLLKLPCAVGDTVYLVSFRKKCYKIGNTYLVNDNLECAFCESECVCKVKNEYFIEEIKATLPIIGNLIDRPDGFMIFLTRPDAERALAERGEKK